MYKNRENLSPSCSSSEDLVAYLYSEMDAFGRSAFEDHLSVCDNCTAEFAELSLSRLGVYEWHRDEFTELATPRVVIPYGETASVSWFDAVRAFFSAPAFATAAGSLAVVAVVAGVWLTASKRIDVAGVEPVPSPKVVSSPRAEEKRPESGSQLVETSGPGSSAKDARPKTVEPDVVKTSAADGSRTPKPSKVKAERNITPPVQARRPAAPRLNDFDDEDDNTLRLGDLLAEVDTRD